AEIARKISVLENSQNRIETEYESVKATGSMGPSDATRILRMSNSLFSLKSKLQYELSVFPDETVLKERLDAIHGVDLSLLDKTMIELHEKFSQLEDRLLAAKKNEQQISSDGVVSKDEVDNLQSLYAGITDGKMKLKAEVDSLSDNNAFNSFKSRLGEIDIPSSLPQITDMNNDRVNDVDYDAANNSLRTLKREANQLNEIFNDILRDGSINEIDGARLQVVLGDFLASRKNFVTSVEQIPEGEVKNSFLEELSNADSRTISIGEITDDMWLSLSDGNDRVSLAGIVTGSGRINLGKGDDRVAVDTINSPLIIDGGKGNDKAYIGFTASSGNFANFEEIELSPHARFNIDIRSLESLNEKGSVIKIKGHSSSVVDFGGQGGGENLSDHGGTWYQVSGDINTYVVYKHSGGSNIELWFDQQNNVGTII
ncbi:TPA: GA-like domain-containing protein, partial [Escherichia coli]